MTHLEALLIVGLHILILAAPLVALLPRKARRKRKRE